MYRRALASLTCLLHERKLRKLNPVVSEKRQLWQDKYLSQEVNNNNNNKASTMFITKYMQKFNGSKYFDACVQFVKLKLTVDIKFSLDK